MSGNVSGLYVAPVSYDATKPLLLQVHYARRMPSITYAFGLFNEDCMEGVVTYGTPASSTLRNGICGPTYAPYVLELNRLCLHNNIKGNASLLIGRSLRLLKGNKIVVSFADTAQGHIGTIYQATNFIYSGLSAKRTDWKIKGKEHLHGQTIADEFRGVEHRAQAMREKYGDDFYLMPRSRKHRYVFFIGDRSFKKGARKALRYKEEPYPKQISGSNQ